MKGDQEMTKRAVHMRDGIPTGVTRYYTKDEQSNTNIVSYMTIVIMASGFALYVLNQLGGFLK